MATKRTKLKGDNVKPFEIIMNEFNGGTMTLPDESRIPPKAMSVTTNHILDEDGIWRPRPGSQNYGHSLTGPIDGIGTATVYGAGTSRTTYLLVVDNGSLKYSTDGGAWTTVSGKTYTTGKRADMLQMKSRVYIANGYDNLSYLDLNTLMITTYTALTAPTLPGTPLARTTLTSGSFNVYYQVSAVSDIGETIASTEATITVNKVRNNWSLTANENITFTWNTVTGAKRYNIYYTDQTGQEVFLDSTTALSYVDTGVATPNPYQAAPAFDGTAGPAVSKLCMSGNRLWGTGDPNNRYRISFTGVGASLGSFNPYVGGGYIDLNLGSEEIPIDLQHFRNGKGDQMLLVLTSGPTGGGSTWFITLSTLTVDVVNVVVPQAVSQGSIGSDAPYGNVQAMNNIYYPSIKGFQQVGSSQAIFNVIVTTEVSANIRPNVRSITSTAASQICGIYSYGKIYWSVPYASSVNNQIWVLDLERQCWEIAFTIGVEQFIEYSDSAGVVHLLALPVTGTNLIEFNQTFQGDQGTPFDLDLTTGLIYINDNHFQQGKVRKVYAELGRFKGTLDFNVYGTVGNKPLALLKTLHISDTSSLGASGLGNDLMGDVEMGDSNYVPTVAATQSSIKKSILLNKVVNNLKLQLQSSDINTDYKLLEFGVAGQITPVADPSSWRK
jgi:hypothetical protein